MTLKERNEITKAKAREIAQAMGPNWSEVSEEEDWRAIISDGNLSLSVIIISCGAQKGRLIISGDFYGCYQTRYVTKNEKRAEIGVSGDKSPEKIAQDIKKRLLPIYEPQLAKARECKQKSDDYLNQKKIALEDIATHMHDAQIHEDSITGYDPYLTIDYRSDGFRMEIEVSAEKAKRILAIIYEESEVKP